MNQDSFSIPITNFSPFLYLTILTVLFLLPKTTLCVIDPKFQACVPKTCGDGQTNISYPFWIDGLQQSYCGYPGFKVSCNNHGHPIFNISNNTYIIQNIFYHNLSFRLVNAEFFYRTNFCFPPIQNLTVFGVRYSFPFNYSGVIFLYPNCSISNPKSNLTSYRVNCSDDDGTGSGLAVLGKDPNLDYVSKNCNGGVKVPVELYRDEGNRIGEKWEYYENVLRRGFVLNWIASNCGACEKSGGRCGFDLEAYHFQCFCHDRPHSAHCPSSTASIAFLHKPRRRSGENLPGSNLFLLGNVLLHPSEFLLLSLSSAMISPPCSLSLSLNLSAGLCIRPICLDLDELWPV